MHNIDLNLKKKFVYSLYSYLDDPNAAKESITMVIAIACLKSLLVCVHVCSYE